MFWPSRHFRLRSTALQAPCALARSFRNERHAKSDQVHACEHPGVMILNSNPFFLYCRLMIPSSLKVQHGFR
jgi:hypothetical protein